jgi:hypothetical protein
MRAREEIMNKKVIAGFAAAGVLTGGAGAASVLTDGSVAPVSAMFAASHSVPRMSCAVGALNHLVRTGMITQGQATAVQNAFSTYMRDHSRPMGGYMGSMRHLMGDMAAHGPMATMLRQMVSKGTITRAQATVIIEQMRTHCAHWHGAGMMGGGYMR